MGNTAELDALREACAQLGVSVPEERWELLFGYRELLLKWNAKVNLTAITDPREVLEKHFIDSLAILPELGGARSLLDVGAGAGMPGIPLKVARPGLEVTLVDTVARKVAFMKAAIAGLRLFPGAKAVHARAEGEPDAEGLPRVEVAVSRAFTGLKDWVPLGARYLQPGGRVIAMTGRVPAEGEKVEAAERSGLRVVSARDYRLPWSGAQRSVLVFGPAD